MILLIGLLICLLFIIWQDFKFRQIHVVLPILVFGFSYFLTDYFTQNVKNLLFNVLFLSITLFVLFAYISIKKKSIVNPFKHYFGLGDLLFFLAITPLFTTYNYILFFILALLFSILMQVTLKKWIKKDSVPLAGLVSVFLVFIILCDAFLSFQKLTLIR